MARRTKEEALETRNRLLDTAERVFNENGVSRTSLAEIAAAAGVTRGAIYWHFKNKIDLFDAMMDRVKLPMEAAFEEFSTADHEDPVSLIRQRGLLMLQSIETNLQVQRVFEIVSHKCEYVDEMAPLRERNLECRTECIAHMAQGIKAAVDLGMMHKTTKPKAAAIGLHAMIDGLIVNWLLHPAEFSLLKEGGKMIDTYLRGLGADLPEETTRTQTAVRNRAKSAVAARLPTPRRRAGVKISARRFSPPR